MSPEQLKEVEDEAEAHTAKLRLKGLRRTHAGGAPAFRTFGPIHPIAHMLGVDHAALLRITPHMTKAARLVSSVNLDAGEEGPPLDAEHSF